MAVTAPLALKSGKDIALSDRAPGVAVLGEHAALVIVLINLIENAVAHTAPGTTVQVELSAPATLRVLDRGPGVPQAQREAIFSRFHRAAGASAGGAGLGLAIVAAIVAMHGAEIGVEDRSGGGAAFRITFPRHVPRARAGRGLLSRAPAA